MLRLPCCDFFFNVVSYVMCLLIVYNLPIVHIGCKGSTENLVLILINMSYSGHKMYYLLVPIICTNFKANLFISTSIYCK